MKAGIFFLHKLFDNGSIVSAFALFRIVSIFLKLIMSRWMKKVWCNFWYYKIQSKLDMVVLFFFFFFTIITSLSVGTPASYCLYRCFLNICELFKDFPIFHFQGLVIQNLAVVSVSFQDLASLQIRFVRWYPIPPPVPRSGFDPWTSTCRVRRSTD